jgi:hypothetical protein
VIAEFALAAFFYPQVISKFLRSIQGKSGPQQGSNKAEESMWKRLLLSFGWGRVWNDDSSV